MSGNSKLNSYSEVFALDEEELRSLLAIDDMPVKVWASWALGVKLNDSEFPKEMRQVIAEEPSPGVRQNLLVFLAGNGDCDLLEQYASHDPNASVRAAACNLLARVATDIGTENALLESLLLSDPSKEVQDTILSAAIRDKRSVSLGVLRKILEQSDLDLQEKTLDVVGITGERIKPSDTLVLELQSWSTIVPAELYNKFCRILLKIASAEGLLQIAQSRPELATIALSVLRANSFRTDLVELGAFADSNNALEVEIVMDLLIEDESADRAIWLMSVLDRSNDNAHEWYNARRLALSRVYAILESPTVPTRTIYAGAVLTILETELGTFIEPDPDDTWDQNEDDLKRGIAHYDRFMKLLRPWI